MSTRFFALIDPPWGTVESDTKGLFREVHDEDGMRLERLSKTGEWLVDNELAKYIFQGEPGAVEIDKKAADALAKKLTGAS